MSISNLVLQIPLFEYASVYLVSILFVTIVGVIIIEWFDRRFEKLIAPICRRVTARREIVVAREKKMKKLKQK